MISRIHFPVLALLASIFLLVLSSPMKADIGDCGIESSTPLYSQKPDTLAVILVEFTDVRHDSFMSGGSMNGYDKKYKWQDFYNMLVRRDYYETPDPTDPSSYPRSPDNEPVYGSFTDYFDDMSNENYTITVVIENEEKPDDYPKWAKICTTKAYFATHESEFADSAKAAAQREGIRTTTNAQRRICYIYAGNRWDDIKPRVEDLGGNWMRVHERWNTPYNEEHQTDKLTHIGMFCHEFTHILGADHHGVALWDIMGNGQKCKTGGGRFGNCPAPIDPWWRYKQGWLSMNFLTGDATKTLIYDNTANNYYVWDDPDSDDRLLVENRQFTNGFDRGLPGHETYSNGGLLIWHIKGNESDGSDIDLIESDTVANETTAELDIFRPDGTPSYNKIHDFSSPANLRLENDELSHFAVDDYTSNGNSITVDFKTSYLSTDSDEATALNNSRKLVRDANGGYHLVYQANNDIHYQYSSDGGASWINKKMVHNAPNALNYPAIVATSNKVFVVWQRDFNSNFYIVFRSKIDGTWQTTKTIFSGAS